jgi:CubicO group peptidase (beta-lactamase class C family)
MRRTIQVLLLLATAMTLCKAAAAPATESPTPSTESPFPSTESPMPPRQRQGRAIEGMVESTGEESLRKFIEEHLAPDLSDSFTTAALLDSLRSIREACAGFEGVLYQRVGENGTRITFMQGPKKTTLYFRIQPAPPNLITAMERGPSQDSGELAPPVPPFTWGSLARDLDQVAADGFSGTVLVVHDGRIFLHQGYGLADRDKHIPNTTHTIYGIGSVPIDFTRAAIWKLQEMGKLRTSDPITAYLPDVPADKRPITIDQLMTGRSGLPNFHNIPGVDADPDLSWIDRETAIRRILGQDLLFAPGQGQAHSHSAWVLLAAIVELVSKQPYGEFLRQNFFIPAGMSHTGLHQYAARLEDSLFAVGYGRSTSGKLNIPKYWGDTSWLVMGSGGMYSTPEDLYKWIEAIRQARTLTPASAAHYWIGGLLTGGDMRGFLCAYTEGPKDYFILCSNTDPMPGSLASGVGDRLEQLVRGATLPPFSLGVELMVDPAGRVAVRRVRPGSAAARDGLKEGDLLLSADGDTLHDPPLPILAPHLRTGQPIRFEVDRAGSRSQITVTPLPRQ